jgi:hypothetical protein
MSVPIVNRTSLWILEYGHKQFSWHFEVDEVCQNLFAGPTERSRQRHLSVVVQVQKTVKCYKHGGGEQNSELKIKQ